MADLRYLSYIEPAWGYKETLAVEYVLREDEAIRQWQEAHPHWDYTGIEGTALDDFVAVHWATFI